MALVRDMGVVGTGGEILQPKMKNRWRVSFLGFGGPNSDVEALTFQPITVDRPKLTFDNVQLDRYNSRAYIAGKHTFDPMNITFEDDIGGRVSQAVQDQIERQQNIIGINPSPRLPAAISGSRYKFSIQLDILDGDNLTLERWYVEGAFIETVDYTDLDYSTSEPVKITLTIRYDHARQIVVGLTDSADGKATGGDASLFRSITA